MLNLRDYFDDFNEFDEEDFDGACKDFYSKYLKTDDTKNELTFKLNEINNDGLDIRGTLGFIQNSLGLPTKENKDSRNMINVREACKFITASYGNNTNLLDEAFMGGEDNFAKYVSAEALIGCSSNDIVRSLASRIQDETINNMSLNRAILKGEIYYDEDAGSYGYYSTEDRTLIDKGIDKEI